jgi:Skp family chaperone for outer membrane proteins
MIGSPLRATVLALCVLGFVGVADALAQTRIVVVNIRKVFSECAEAKEFQKTSAAMGASAQEADRQFQADAEKKTRERDQFEPDSAEFRRAEEEILKVLVDREAAKQQFQLRAARATSVHLRGLNAKLSNIVKDLAEEEGIDLVLNELTPGDVPADQLAKLNPEQLAEFIGRQTMLYVKKESDKTDLVIARLDAGYQSGR